MRKRLVWTFFLAHTAGIILLLVDFFADTSQHWLFIALPVFLLYVAVLTRWFNKSIARIKAREQDMPHDTD